MIDENKVTAAIQEFCKNPKWDEIFRNAPGGAMERLAISFYFSENGKSFSQEDLAEYRTLRDEIEKTLDKEDLEYLINKIGKDKTAAHYRELLEALPPEGPDKSKGIGGGLAAAKEGEGQQEAHSGEEKPQEKQEEGQESEK